VEQPLPEIRIEDMCTFPQVPPPGYGTETIALDLFKTSHAAFAFSLLTGIYGLMQTVISTLIGHRVNQSSFCAICVLGAVSPICGIVVLY
jgi:hypothetical protein